MSLLRHGAVSATEGRDGLSLCSTAFEHPPASRLATPVRRAITRTRGWLLGQQHPEGYWAAELEGDSILQSETILLLAFLGQEDSELARRCAQRLVETQLPGGGWAMYPGGGVEISGSVKAYFALKLLGYDLGAEPMQRARKAILAHGGADAVNSYTRFFLAMLGQIPYRQCPAVPPEVVLLPKWFPVNLYAMSSWSRTIVVPLSIVSAKEPVRAVGADRGIRELFLREPDDWPPLRCPGLPGGTGLMSWDRFFRVVDRFFKCCQRHGLLPLRSRAIRAAEQWMLARFEHSDGLGAIFPPIVWSLVALRCLGYADDSPAVRYCHQQLADLVLQDERTGSARVQPCKSPVWDTAITLRALSAGGIRADNPAMLRAVEWLLDRQITRPGDWSETVAAEPGGWCFEFHNDFYPDADDTAMVLMALCEQFDGTPPDRTAPDERPPELRLVHQATLGDRDAMPKALDVLQRASTAIERGLAWMLAMQNDDGGWGAFDRNNNRRFLCYVPFADHNAMIDPSTPDLTGRVLEALGKLGRRTGDPAVDRAVAYLRKTQEPDGSWFGRWGVNHVYGTWQSLTGLTAVGVPTDDHAVVAGANWLLACQQSCGGWGESPDSYADRRCRGMGPPTASQTAWAVLGLLAAGLERHPAVTRGIRFLLERQQRDGTWYEPEFTGTGFPRVFYLRYHYYPIYFPLMALSRWAMSAAAPVAEAALADRATPRVAEPLASGPRFAVVR
jgi:squalene-hopene/tetraprenyl-beta-curcumene cyclase